MIFFISFWMIFEAFGHIGRFNTVMIFSNIFALKESLTTILVSTELRDLVLTIEAVFCTITDLSFKSAVIRFAWAKYR